MEKNIINKRISKTRKSGKKAEPKKWGKTLPKGDHLTRSLTDLLREKNVSAKEGGEWSDATVRKRAQTLRAGFRTLQKLGFKLTHVSSFRGRHMTALVKEWVRRGLKAATLQNNHSAFRTLAEWLGKRGMVEPLERYLDDPAIGRRSSVSKQDKSWTPRGFDVVAIFEEVRKRDPRVAMALEINYAFGLRAQESLVLRPHMADLKAVLDARRGVKNGRHRLVPLDLEIQRDVLERAKALVGSRLESIAGPIKQRRLHQAINHFYYIVRSAGIRKENGITVHGLRHEYANEYFARLTGYRSPVQGGPAPTDPETERFARIMVAESLGHSRENVTTYYLGRFQDAENPTPKRNGPAD